MFYTRGPAPERGMGSGRAGCTVPGVGWGGGGGPMGGKFPLYWSERNCDEKMFSFFLPLLISFFSI